MYALNGQCLLYTIKQFVAVFVLTHLCQFCTYRAEILQECPGGLRGWFAHLSKKKSQLVLNNYARMNVRMQATCVCLRMHGGICPWMHVSMKFVHVHTRNI